MPSRPEVALALVLALAAAGPAAGQSGADLMKVHGCVACHDVNKKLIGPPYKEVAAKYKGDKSAATKLAAKVKVGGQGVWGEVPMPPNPKVPEADIRKLVEFVLGLKK